MVKDIDGNPLGVSGNPIVPIKKVSGIPKLKPFNPFNGGSMGGAPQGIGKLAIPPREEGDF